MFIFETSSHIWAFLRVLLHSVLFFYRADMSWESFWQFRLVCSAWCTHFCLGSLLTFLLALYICFHGWTGGKTGSSRWSGQVVVFALQIGDGATTLPHHSHTQTRGHFFCTQYTSKCTRSHKMVTGMHPQTQHDVSAARRSVHGKVILLCEPAALGESVCHASEQLEECAHMSIYKTSSL